VHKHPYPRLLNLKAILPQLQTLAISSAVPAATSRTRVQPSHERSSEQLNLHVISLRPELPIREARITTIRIGRLPLVPKIPFHHLVGFADTETGMPVKATDFVATTVGEMEPKT
jgi:hypothetical protein